MRQPEFARALRINMLDSVEEHTDFLGRTDMPTIQKASNFLRRSFSALIAAREREAELYVSRALLAFDDETLRLGGYNRKDLERRVGYRL